MSSATLERLVAHFDRREQRTLPPAVRHDATKERAALRERVILTLEKLDAQQVLELRDSSGRTIVDSLLTIAEGVLWAPFTLSPGRTRLFSELVFNIADPKRINQGLKGTCAAACIESWLVERDPAEYARIVTELITREGQALLKSGAQLICDEDVLAPNELERGRNAVSRVFQAACMEFAYPNMHYDNVVDGLFDGDENVGTGLELSAFERLLGAVTGLEWKTISKAHARMKDMFARVGINTKDMADIARDGLAIIEQSTGQNENVFVTLELPSVPNPIPSEEEPVLYNMPHKVRAVRVDRHARRIHYDDPMDPTRRWFDGANMTVHDPYGHCSMPIDDFLRLMTELSYRSELFKRGAESDQQAPAQPRTV